MNDNFSISLNTSYKLQKQQMCFEFEKYSEIFTSEISMSSSFWARYMISNSEIYYNLEIISQDTHVFIHQWSALLENELSWKLQNEQETKTHELEMMKIRLELTRLSDTDSVKSISFHFKLFEFKKKIRSLISKTVFKFEDINNYENWHQKLLSVAHFFCT